MNEEDEAFEQLSLKQGSWEHTSGWRKKQIAHMDMHSHPAEFVHLHRNDTLEEVATIVEMLVADAIIPAQDIARIIRSMKK